MKRHIHARQLLRLILFATLFAAATVYFVGKANPEGVLAKLAPYIWVAPSVLTALAVLSHVNDVLDLLSKLLPPSRAGSSSVEESSAHERLGRELRTNLPQSHSSQLVGRQDELLALIQMIYSDGGSHTIAIDGIGGVGKSALAIAVARRILDDSSVESGRRFDAIVWYAARPDSTDLNSTSNSNGVDYLDELLTSIAVTLEGRALIQAPRHIKAELVRQQLQDSRVLLVVDNFEIISDARLSDFISQVPAPTRVLIVTRKRQALLRSIRLHGLNESDATEMLRGECAARGVKLNLEEETQLVDRTGGIPLVIALCAALVKRGYTVSTVISRLATIDDEITSRCFGAVIDAIKTSDAYEVLLALALFPDGAEKVAIANTAGVTMKSCEDALVQLDDLSLLAAREPLYRVLPLTMEYCQQLLKLRVDLERAMRERYVEHYVRRLRLRGERYSELNSISREMRNIEEALEWLLALNRVKDYVELLASMNFYFWATGSWATWERMLGRGVRIAEELGDDLSRANFLTWHSSMAYYQGSIEEAERFILGAIEIFESTESLRELAIAVRRLATIRIKQLRPDDARALLEKALGSSRTSGDMRNVSRIQRQLARLDIDDQFYDMASLRLDEAIALRSTSVNQTSGLAHTYRLRGKLALITRQLDDAERYLELALDVAERIDNRQDEAEALILLAELAVLSDECAKARSMCDRAERTFRRLGMKSEIEEVLKLSRKIDNYCVDLAGGTQ